MERTLVIGVDIGGTRTKYGLVNIETGEVLQSLVLATEKTDATAFLDQVAARSTSFKGMPPSYRSTWRV